MVIAYPRIIHCRFRQWRLLYPGGDLVASLNFLDAVKDASEEILVEFEIDQSIICTSRYCLVISTRTLFRDLSIRYVRVLYFYISMIGNFVRFDFLDIRIYWIIAIDLE